MAEETSRPSGANKYSVYAQKSVDSTQVNWNEISGQLVKGLETIRDERQGRKDAIEKATQESIEQLSQVPETGTQDAASLLINGSAMSVEAVRTQNNLMKRGLISPKDNMLFMQQQKTGYKNLSSAVKNWDDWAVEARTRLEDPNISSGNLETFTNLQTEALGNLRNKKLWTNPTNGKMQLVTMGKNSKTGLYDVMPDYETRKQDYQDPNTMMNFMKYKNAGVDVNEMAKKQTANIAEIVTANRERLTALGGGGGINSIEDFRQLGEFGKDENGGAITYDMWKKDQIDAMVGTASDKSNLSAAEVLTNSGGYFFAQTESQFKEEHPNIDILKMIKVDMGTGQPVPTMSDAQMKQARKLADVAVESQVSHIVKMTEGKGAKEAQLPNNATIAQSKLDRSMVGYMDDANAITSDDESTFEATAQDRIVALNKEMQGNGGDPNKMIDSITRDDTTIKFTLADGTVETIPRLEDGVPRNAEEVVREVYRLITPQTDDYSNSFKDAKILYKKEPGGGFRATDRDMTDTEMVAAAAENKAKQQLEAAGIKPDLYDINNNKTGVNPEYEQELATKIIDLTPGISDDEKAAVKKRVLKNITGQKYRALTPLPPLKQNTSKIGVLTSDDGTPSPATGTELIEDKIGDRLDGLSTMGGDDSVEVNDVLSQVMNDYLPDAIKGGAKVVFKKDDVDDSKWVVEVSYFDRAGVQQSLPPIYPNVGTVIGFDGSTPSELNEVMHKAAQEVLDEENARLTTRNQRGTGKKRKKFN